MLPKYDTKLFTDIWGTASDFLADYQDNGITALLDDDSITTLYYLLYARYGNSPIANYDETQFKYKVMSVIFMYGPSWEKRVEIQKKIRNLTDDELMTGSKQIFNHAYNPSTTPSTATLEEITYINDQNTSNNKRGKAEAYSMLLSLLETDVTKSFIEMFKDCFLKVVAPQRNYIYVTDLEEDED